MLDQLAKEHAALGGRPLETLPTADPPAKPKKRAKAAPAEKVPDEQTKDLHPVEDVPEPRTFASGLEDVCSEIEKALENVAKPSRLWTPFLTGSRVYGTPTEDSDVDLVVLTEPETRTALFDVAEEFDGVDRYGVTTSSLVFGGLNLLVETDRRRFLIWKLGTNYLKTQAPVTRDEAVEFFRKLRSHFLRIKPTSQSPGKS
jgi:predicted nucleotidyltransferase